MDRIINHVNWKIGGEAGKGIMVTGAIFSKMCTRGGLHVFDYIEYPSLIRGGHNCYQVRVEPRPVYSQLKPINVLLALNEETVYLHMQEIAPGGHIVYDAGRITLNTNKVRQDVKLCHVPTLNLAKEVGATEVMENSVMLGVTCGMLQYDFNILITILSEVFSSKGPAVVEENHKAAKAGYDYAMKHFANDFPHDLVPEPNIKKLMVITGNEAIALGALQAGCKFYAAYPMTPASSILHTMAAHGPMYNCVVKHAEDEISVANMTLGAAHAGVRSMCATSGGGYALMNETLSLGGITETPAVFVEAMRGGPATGVPTWTEQSDLKFVLNSGHGDFPRFVVAPGDATECYYLTQDAFNIAEKYQNPVTVLTDKYLAESHIGIELFDPHRIKIDRGKLLSDVDVASRDDFNRYALSPDGVSERSLPGQKGGMFVANSDEHDGKGFSTEEIDLRNAMHEKRMQKMETAKNDIPDPILYGPEEAALTIVAFGSTKGPVLEAMRFLEQERISVNFLHLTWVSPFPAIAVEKQLIKAKRTLIIEGNISGQLEGVIREQAGVTFDHHYRRYDGRPFYPEDIKDKVMEVLHG